MTVQIGGTLGDISQTVQAKPCKPMGTAGVRQDFVDCWTTVEAYIRANPDKGIVESIRACGYSPDLYYRAKRKMESNEKPRGSINERIRPNDKIVQVSREQQTQIEERAAARHRSRLEMVERACGEQVKEDQAESSGFGNVQVEQTEETKAASPAQVSKPLEGSKGISPSIELPAGMTIDEDQLREMGSYIGDQLKEMARSGGTYAEKWLNPQEETAEEPPLPEQVLVEVMAWLRQLPISSRTTVIDAALTLLALDASAETPSRA